MMTKKQECVKIRFELYLDAIDYIKNWNPLDGGRPPNRVYKCGVCQGYHMTKKRVRTLWNNDGDRVKAPLPKDAVMPKKDNKDKTLNIKTNLL